MHPVGAFALFDAAVRFAALASAHPGLGWRPWLVAGSPGFLVCVVSDVLLAIALWNLTWNAPGIFSRRVALRAALAVVVFAGLALFVSEAVVYSVAARHLNQIPVNNMGFGALAYVLRVPQYAGILAGGVAAVIAVQWWLARLANRSRMARRADLAGAWTPGRRAASVVLALAAAWATAQYAARIEPARGLDTAGSSRPLWAIASSAGATVVSGSLVNEASVARVAGLAADSSARPSATPVVLVQMTDAERDLVAGIGLPAWPRRKPADPSIPRLKQLPPKVILVTVESLARSLVRKFHVPRPQFTLPDWATPTMDKLAETSVSFNAHGTTMMPTQPGLYTTLLSRCVLKDHEVAAPDHRPLAEVLRDAGYETSYFQGAEMTYGRMDYYTPMIFRYGFRAGFHEIAGGSGGSGGSNIGEDKWWGWGLHDDVVFDAAWRAISADRGGSGRRQFVHILTVDTHPPFGSEQHFTDAPAGFPGADPMVRGLYATDRAIGRLLARLEESGLMGQGALVIVTADHSPSHLYARYMPDNPRMLNDLIPLFIKHRDLDPAKVSAAVTGRMSSQIDVAPTVVGLMGLDVPRSWAGRDLFDPATPPLWVSNEDPIGKDNQTVGFKLPGRAVYVPSKGEITESGAEGDLRRALQKWMLLKHQESKGESLPATSVARAAGGEGAGIGKIPGGATGLEVAAMPGGVRVLRPPGARYMLRVDQLWAGGPIVFQGVRKKGVTLRVPGAFLVEVPAGTRVLSGQIGVLPYREQIHWRPGRFEWRFKGVPERAPGGAGGAGGDRGAGEFMKIQMPGGKLSLRDFRLDVPAGVTRVQLQLDLVDIGDNGTSYDEGYLGGLVAGR